LTNALLGRLPFAPRRRGVSMRVRQAGGALVLAALGTAITYVAVARRAAAARLRRHPEAPVIVWEG
jgi:hypothetical protein